MLLGALALPSRAQDPFQPGQRWVLPPDLSEPAIPSAVAFGAGENVVWSAGLGGVPAATAASVHSLGPSAPLARDAAFSGTSGAVAVAAGAGPWLFSLTQHAAPDPYHRRTRIGAYHAGDLGAGSPLAARWTRELPFTANGPARLACDRAGASLVVAAWDDAAVRVRVERLAAADGAVLWSRDFAAAGLQEVRTSEDGARSVLTAGLELRVLDGLGATSFVAPLAVSTAALALSGDGLTVAHGAGGLVRVLADAGAGYALVRAIAGGPQETAVRVALARDGRTLVVAWWNAASANAWRFEVWDVAAGVRLVERAQAGPPGGLQNLPTAVALTPDGSRAAFACWGDGTAAPELGIWDRASNAFVLEADLAGSPLAVAFDERGTRLVVAQKTTHANLLSGTGELRLFDTGERDLQVLGQPRVGAQLHLAARRAGAGAVIFLDGQRADVPLFVPGVAGQLLLLRQGLSVVRVPADASGRADVRLALPADPALVGTYRHLQAAFRVGSATVLGAVLSEPLLL